VAFPLPHAVRLILRFPDFNRRRTAQTAAGDQPASPLRMSAETFQFFPKFNKKLIPMGLLPFSFLGIEADNIATAALSLADPDVLTWRLSFTFWNRPGWPRPRRPLRSLSARAWPRYTGRRRGEAWPVVLRDCPRVRHENAPIQPPARRSAFTRSSVRHVGRVARKIQLFTGNPSRVDGQATTIWGASERLFSSIPVSPVPRLLPRSRSGRSSCRRRSNRHFKTSLLVSNSVKDTRDRNHARFIGSPGLHFGRKTSLNAKKRLPAPICGASSGINGPLPRQELGSSRLDRDPKVRQIAPLGRGPYLGGFIPAPRVS